MKKALVIAYYWPPGGGSGVQRWLKFVKYMREFGWEPIVYTPENPEHQEIDESLIKNLPPNLTVWKTPIWEPYDLYRKFTGRKKDERMQPAFMSEKKKGGLAKSISVWVRGNFFIPDARKFWIKPSVKFLVEKLKTEPVDLIISTGPPHSMHLIAMGVKKKTGLPWLADFRDPWTNIDFYDDLKLSPRADAKHHRLERQVLQQADAVVSVGKTMSAEFEEMLRAAGTPSPEKFHVITNGYDEDDVYRGALQRDKKFSIAHIGTMPKARNPEGLWKALKILVAADPAFAADLEIKLVGKVDVAVMESLNENGLAQYLHKIEYRPQAEVVRIQQESQVLLLVLNNTRNAKGILTGKFFEYMSARRPILAVGPIDGDAAEIIRQAQAGVIAGYEDVAQLKKTVAEFYAQFKNGTLEVHSEGVGQYSRKALTEKLAALMNTL